MINYPKSLLVDMLKTTADNSNDPHTKVGAILMSRNGDIDFDINGTGFNTIIGNDPASFERPLKYDRVIHAEMMAIMEAAKVPGAFDDAILAITHPPCKECAKLILAAGIKGVLIGDGTYSSDSPENRAAADYLLRGIEIGSLIEPDGQCQKGVDID